MREIAPVTYAKSVSGPTWNKNLSKIPFPFPPPLTPLPQSKNEIPLLGVSKCMLNITSLPFLIHLSWLPFFFFVSPVFDEHDDAECDYKWHSSKCRSKGQLISIAN